ncbi:MAG: hypothetical protein R2699_04095 [Acidimicrobiales bacterium]
MGPGSDGDGRLPQQRPGHRRHDRRRRLAAHRRRRPHRRGQALLDRRPPQGAHQVQGLPGAARQLEALLLTHDAVADAAVIGVPDDEAGELPKAFIALAGTEASAQDIQGFVADQVAHYKQVRIVEFVDEIPKSASGKILRRLLRDQS